MLRESGGKIKSLCGKEGIMKETNKFSNKAKLLFLLREKQGKHVSGSKLAKEMGVSRVAVWKAVQTLVEAGYLIETGGSGYLLDPKNEKDFLYPWEFGEKENLFYYYKNTGSTMDAARELAFRGAGSGTVITAERQSAGKGRNGRTWVSRQGGLFFTVLERPSLSIADSTLPSLIMQIAVARCLSSVCGKKTYIRWPNDIFINSRKIAGIITEISAEGDLITWLAGGIGVNINNSMPSGKITTCAEITGRHLSRREILVKILCEIEKTKKAFSSHAEYFQGNRSLAAEWNSLTDCIGAKAAVFVPENCNDNSIDKPCKIYARGTFRGIDPAGRCILKTENGNLFFNQGTVSMALLNPDN
jgi:BirA family biotin operon repressor/biotin-[acetyl-CoA-carboxylase] ligase